MSDSNKNKKPRKPRLQACLRQLTGRCVICPEAREPCLQIHRILPGEKGGRYVRGNCVCLCANCHSLVTAGVFSTFGILSCSYWPAGVLHWSDGGQEHFSPIPVSGRLPRESSGPSSLPASP